MFSSALCHSDLGALGLSMFSTLQKRSYGQTTCDILLLLLVLAKVIVFYDSNLIFI